MADFDELEFERSIGALAIRDDEEDDEQVRAERAFEASLLAEPEPQEPVGAGARLLEQISARDQAERAHEESLQAEYGGGFNRTIAAAQGGLRGLTLGISDVIAAGAAGAANMLVDDGPQLTAEARAKIEELNKTRDGKIALPEEGGSFRRGYEGAREYQEGIREANPGTALTSEVGGALLAGLATGGTGAVARGLAATPAGLVTRAGAGVTGALRGAAPSVLRAGAAAAAGGALEGALAGGILRGTELSPAELADPAEIGESLAAAAVQGGILGGVMGGLFGTAERALTRGASKFDDLATKAAPKTADAGADVAQDFETITMQLEARPLTAAQVPDPARGKWQAMLARSEAAQGGFDNAVQEGTSAIRSELDNVLRDINAVDEFGGIAAKVRANAFNVGHPVGTGEVDAALSAIDANIGAFMTRNSKAALAYDGGLNAIERVKNVITDQRKMVGEALSKGDIGEAYAQLDNLKRSIGRARGTKSSSVQDLMEENYAQIQRFMEDEATWGDLAVRQKKANPAWSNRISSSKDARIRQFTSETGGNENRAANEWDQLKLSNSGAIHSLLQNVGDVRVADVEEAFRRNLRSMARDATERTKAWGTPELQARAERIAQGVKSIEDRMDQVALVRRDALAGASQLRQGTVEMIAGAAGMVAPPVGWAVSGTAQVGRKVLQAAGALGGSVREGVFLAAGRLARSAAETAGTASDRVIVAAEVARSQFSEKRIAEAIAEAQQLSDATSPATQQLIRDAAEIEKDDPQLADAYAGTTLRRAQLIRSQLPAQPPPGAVYAPTPQLDPLTQRKVARSIEASHRPQQALDRIASGVSTPEDTKAVRMVYPSTWKRFQETVVNELRAMEQYGGRPTYQTRLRLSYSLGMPLDRSLAPQEIAAQQRVASGPDTQKQAEAQADAKNKSVAAQFKPIDADSVYAGPVDSRIDRR